MPKSLYLAKTLSELNKQADCKPVKVKNPKSLCSTASKLFLEAKQACLQDDEEKAYIYYMRYIGVVETARSHPLYKDNKFEIDKVMSISNLKEALGKAEELADNLKERYTSPSTEVLVEDVEAKRPKIMKPDPSEEMQNGTRKTSIEAVELYQLLQKSPDKVMVLSCRPKSEWDSCHTDTKKFPSWLHIPEEAILKGLTVHLIPNLLTPKGKRIWEGRRDRENVVLVDERSGISSPGKVLLLLKDVIYKYDTTSQISQEPMLLNGGFHKWYLAYSPLCIGKPKLVKDTQSLAPVMRPTTESNLTSYPEFQEDSSPELQLNGAKDHPETEDLGESREGTVSKLDALRASLQDSKPAPTNTDSFTSHVPTVNPVQNNKDYPKSINGAVQPHQLPHVGEPHPLPISSHPSSQPHHNIPFSSAPVPQHNSIESLSQPSLYHQRAMPHQNGSYPNPGNPNSYSVHPVTNQTVQYIPTANSSMQPYTGSAPLPMAPGQGPSMAPGQGPPMAPGQGPPMAPGQGPSMAPGQGPPMAPGQGPSMAPGQRPPMAPAQGPSMAPGQRPPMVPAQGPSMVPAQALNSGMPVQAQIQSIAGISQFQQSPSVRQGYVPIVVPPHSLGHVVPGLPMSQTQHPAPQGPQPLVTQSLSAMPQSMSQEQPHLVYGSHQPQANVQISELDSLGREVQSDIAEQAATTEEIEETKKQLEYLKQLMIQQQKAAQEKEQNMQEMQKKLEEEQKFQALESRLMQLESENVYMKQQQSELAMHTAMVIVKTDQMMSQQPLTDQPKAVQVIQPVQQYTSTSQPCSEYNPSQGANTAVEPPVQTKTDPTSTTSVAAEGLSGTESEVAANLNVNTTGEVPQSQEEESQPEEVKQKLAAEIEAKLRALEMKEQKMKEHQEEMLKQQEAIKKEQFVWQRQKEAEEKQLSEDKARLETERKAFEKHQEEVRLQQDEYRKKQEEVFAMLQLTNRQKEDAPNQMKFRGGNLPKGWEKQLDRRTGRFYYIDHNSKTTHWNPPANWLQYGPTVQPPGQVPSAPQPGQPGPVAAHLQPQPQAQSLPQPQPQSQPQPQAQTTPMPESSGSTSSPAVPNTVQPPEINRSSKPVQPVPQPNRALKPLSQEVVKRKFQVMQPVTGTWGVRGLTGLRNLGNTCFMNSTLQCLFSTVPLVEYFYDEKYRLHINRSSPYNQNGAVAEEFGWIVKNAWCGKFKSFSPRDFKDTIVKCSSRFEGTEQHDSQELLAYLLDGLHEDLNRAKPNKYESLDEGKGLGDVEKAKLQWLKHKKANNSVIVDLFQGQFRSRVRCLKCNYQSTVFEAFMYLLVPIPNGTANYSLKHCINNFVKPERMTGDNRWDCPRCKCRQDVEKVIEIWKLPPLLIIILKRFWWDNNYCRHKISSYVDFPVVGLDMSPHIAGPDKQRTNYSLYATSNHTGRLDSGHYIAYCKNPLTHKFHCFDDHEVKDVSQSSIKSASAYFLFYSLVDFQPPRI